MYKEIWDNLSQYNVTKHLEKKGKFNYLSWADAWAILKKHYPESKAMIMDFEQPDGTTLDARYYKDGTASVTCSVMIGECGQSESLPVMDNRNKAIVDPNAMDINTAHKRCLVKCLALFGLGISVYRGEDLPIEEEISQSKSNSGSPISESGGSNGSIPPTTLDFGKHKGKDVKDVPIDYLKWLKSNSEVDVYKAVAKAEIERRMADAGDTF